MKKYFKRKGISFNPSMDRRQLNLAARILDPIGPLTQLWEAALAANEHQTGLDPAVVVEFVRQAISLVGNASFCGLSDRRKSLLVKVSPESLDLLDERSLFEENSADLFGKKFKKAILKEFKHVKNMDNLLGSSSHGNRKQFFCEQPGKGPGFFPGANARPGIRHWPKVPKTAVGRQRKRSLGVSRQEQRGAINRPENNSRYFTCFKTISRCTGQITEFATHSRWANRTFESFKNRFSRYHSASEVSRPFGSFCSKLAPYFKRPRRFGGRCGLQTRVHNNSIPNRPAPVLHFSKSDSAKIDTEIQSLQQKGALKQVQPEADQFLSNLFLVPKRDGTSCPVVNLKGLNAFLQYTHFKMEGIHLLRDLVQPGD